MTIAIRSNWNGNEAETIFTTVEDAVAHLEAKHPFWEIVPLERLRPYGDVEADVPDGCSEEEFNRVQKEMLDSLINFFDSIRCKYAITTASDFSYKRWSSRWYIADKYVDTLEHAKVFAEHLYDHELRFPHPIEGDKTVYTKHRKMRNGYTLKPNKKNPSILERRDFVLVRGTWEDTMIADIPEGCERHDFDLPTKQSFEGSVVKVDDSELKPLLDCLKLERWTDYTICRNLVWAMCSCGASEATIHQYCMKASNYGRMWVDNLIRDFNPQKTPTITFIKKYARIDSPKQYKQLVHKDPTDATSYIEEMTRLTVDHNVIYDSGRYLMNLPEHDTIASKAPLGGGKTTECKRIIRDILKKNPKARILVLSGRCSFSDHIYGELKPLGFVHYQKAKEENYKNKKGKTTQLDNDLLILQVSPASMSLISEQSYDFVLLDESETILAMMSFLSIHKNTNQFWLMGKTFERLMVESKKVMAFDAFMTDRTLEMLRSLRGEVLVVINTFQPYNKTLIQFQDKESLMKRIATELIQEKKRIVSVWSLKGHGHEFVKLIGDRVKHVFYHKDSDAKVKEQDMMNVDKEWEKYDSVNYTGTITVGVNYSEGKPFDALGLCAHPWGGTSRDTLQSLHRARHVKDNQVYAYIHDGNGPVSAEAGMSAQEEFWAMSKLLRQRILEDMGEQNEDYTTLPDWWKRVMLYNRNEKVVNSLFYPQCIAYYLNACGIHTERVEPACNPLKGLRVRQLSH